MIQLFYALYYFYCSLIIIMGCASSAAEVNKPGKKDTVFGVLEVKLQEAHIEHQTSTFSTMDPYVNIKFSNQLLQGSVVKNGGKNPKFTDSYQFIVNSHFKYFGRCLEVELMDKNIGSDDAIGYGIIDLDPYLNLLHTKDPQPQQKSPGAVTKENKAVTLRCFLNYDRKQAGIVSLLASFKQQKTDIINFRFETAQFQRSTRTFGDMQCYVRVTAGEQVLETKKCRDTKTDKPVWKDQFLSFWCPQSLKEILIQVMDQNELVGSVKIEKSTFLIDDSENQFMRQIKYKQAVAGRLWFNSKRNANPLFKDLKGDYKKKMPQAQKKQQKKGQGKKEQGKKEQQKKQEKKAPEEKKEQKKQEKKQQTK